MKTLLNHSQIAAHDSKGSISLITRLGLLIILIVAFSVAGFSSTVQFTVPQNLIGAPQFGPEITLFSNDLNGVLLNGQSMSMDLVFSGGLLARLFMESGMNGQNAFGFSMIAHTTGHPTPPGPTTGYLLDRNGNPASAPMQATTIGEPGLFSMGFPFLFLPNGADEFETTGLHLDAIFPTFGGSITDAELRFNFYSPDSYVIFGSSQALPEPSTAAGLVIGLAALCSGLLWSRIGSDVQNFPNRKGSPHLQTI